MKINGYEPFVHVDKPLSNKVHSRTLNPKAKSWYWDGAELAEKYNATLEQAIEKIDELRELNKKNMFGQRNQKDL